MPIRDGLVQGGSPQESVTHDPAVSISEIDVQPAPFVLSRRSFEGTELDNEDLVAR